MRRSAILCLITAALALGGCVPTMLDSLVYPTAKPSSAVFDKVEYSYWQEARAPMPEGIVGVWKPAEGEGDWFVFTNTWVYRRIESGGTVLAETGGLRFFASQAYFHPQVWYDEVDVAPNFFRFRYALQGDRLTLTFLSGTHNGAEEGPDFVVPGPYVLVRADALPEGADEKLGRLGKRRSWTEPHGFDGTDPAYPAVGFSP